MRIKSGFHDYYDSVRQHGADPRLVYARRTRTPDPVPDAGPVLEIFGRVPTEIDLLAPPFARGVVAFCGRAHPFVSVRGKTCWNVDDVVAAVRRGLGALDPHDARTRGRAIRLIEDPEAEDGAIRHRYRRSWPTRFDRKLCRPTWDKLTASDLAVPAEVHRRLGTPVFLVRTAVGGGVPRRHDVVLDPVLRELGFFRVAAPAAAFQAIATYLGCEMAIQRDPEVGLTDELQRDSAGFDGWSFKRHRDDPRPPRPRSRSSSKG